MMVFRTPFPRIATTAIASRMSGNASRTSTLRIRILSINPPQYAADKPTIPPMSSPMPTLVALMVSETRAP